MAKISGECACGGIKVSIPKPEGSALCHCKECSVTSGAMHGVYTQVEEISKLEIDGHPLKWENTGNSGQKVERFFCGTCGSPIYSHALMFKDKPFVRLALFDKSEIPKPTLELFCRDMPSWEQTIEGSKAIDTE